ncbi:MAG: glycosyltransferase family 2 protein [Clostridia bacterium]|nr:glycosyltransferase family 2 protein [Clostridia bacterium]
MIFADPTHKRVYILSVILLAAVLLFIYLKLFTPYNIIGFRYLVLGLRFKTVVFFNRFFEFLIVLNFVKLFVYSLIAKKSSIKKPGFTPQVTAVIPAYNEEKTIVATVNSVLAADYKKLEVIVVDDGSKDKTYEILKKEFGENPRVKIITKENGGKYSALNEGIAQAKGNYLLLLDADTLIAPDSVKLLVSNFTDGRVAAVSGNTRVGNVHNLITGFQRVEYIRDFNLTKNGMTRLNAMAVVPGALGMWRKSAVIECGGFSPDTLGEDRDLTMALLDKGYKAVFEPSAFSETEAPDTLRGFMRQRFRWTYSTLQCVVKYLRCLFNPFKKGLGLILMPDLLIFQIILPLFTTVGFVLNLFHFDSFEAALLAASYAFSVVTELLLFLLSKRITKEKIYFKDIFAVIPQRMFYGIFCTFILFKAALYAFIGTTVLWNKVERKGNNNAGKVN